MKFSVVHGNFSVLNLLTPVFLKIKYLKISMSQLIYNTCKLFLPNVIQVSCERTVALISISHVGVPGAVGQPCQRVKRAGGGVKERSGDMYFMQER